MEVHIHTLKLNSKDKFAEKFNQVSELYESWRIEVLKPEIEADPEKEKLAWELYFEAKFRLESGQ